MSVSERDRDEREREENVLSSADIPACDTVKGAMSKMKMEC